MSFIFTLLENKTAKILLSALLLGTVSIFVVPRSVLGATGITQVAVSVNSAGTVAHFHFPCTIPPDTVFTFIYPGSNGADNTLDCGVWDDVILDISSFATTSNGSIYAFFDNGDSFVTLRNGSSPISGQYQYYSKIDYDLGVFSSSGGLLVDDFTHFETVTPPDNSFFSFPSGTIDVGYTGVLGENDFNSGSRVVLCVENGDTFLQNLGGSCVNNQFLQASFFLDVQDLVNSGLFSFDTTLSALPLGRYYITATIQKGSNCFLGFCFASETVLATSTRFLVGTTTVADLLVQQRIDFDNGLNVATTSALSINCSLLQFDFFQCSTNLAILLFLPSQSEQDSFINGLRSGVLTHFPLGYITDFVDIVSTTTTRDLVVLQATVPPGIPGAGASITLDLAHSLDFILNATSSSFISGFATSSATFYEITSGYWRIFVYIMALFYVLSRILGSFANVHTKKTI